MRPKSTPLQTRKRVFCLTTCVLILATYKLLPVELSVVAELEVVRYQGGGFEILRGACAEPEVEIVVIERCAGLEAIEEIAPGGHVPAVLNGGIILLEDVAVFDVGGDGFVEAELTRDIPQKSEYTLAVTVKPFQLQQRHLPTELGFEIVKNLSPIGTENSVLSMSGN